MRVLGGHPEYYAPGRAVGGNVATVSAVIGCRSQYGYGNQPDHYCSEPRARPGIPALSRHEMPPAKRARPALRPPSIWMADPAHPDTAGELRRPGLGGPTTNLGTSPDMLAEDRRKLVTCRACPGHRRPQQDRPCHPGIRRSGGRWRTLAYVRGPSRTPVAVNRVRLDRGSRPLL